MKILNDFDYFDDYQVIGCGENGHIRAFNDDAYKIFQIPYISLGQIASVKKKATKLKILKELQLDSYVKIKELYGYEDNSKVLLWAYKMQRLTDNVLKKIHMYSLSLEQKSELLMKVYNILQKGHEYGIYNWDLDFDNFYLNKDGRLIGLDVDNLKVKTYSPEEVRRPIFNFIDSLSNIELTKQDNIRVENYAFLRMCLKVWTIEYYDHMGVCALNDLINRLKIDESLKEVMYAVLKNDANVDLKDIINKTTGNIPYLRTKGFF